MAGVAQGSQTNKLPTMEELDRVYNFSAGPCTLPIEVLEECRGELMNYKGCGMSVMEMSHRSKEFLNIMASAQKDLRDVLEVPDNYKIMFLQGGATLQFSSIPLNMFGGENPRTKADYAVTGQWGEKAWKECAKYGSNNKVCDTKGEKFTHIPAVESWNLGNPDETAYLHYCANETVNGVQFHQAPVLPEEYAAKVPLIADMSSEFLSKPVEVSKHALIYAGAQKNIGPSGNCVLIAREDYLDGSKELKYCPTYCSWMANANADSMYNTPATFSIYVTGVYLNYTKSKGGLGYWSALSQKKSGMIYDAIDNSDGFYTNPVNVENRSQMNIPFQILGGDAALEKKFLEEAKKVKLYTLAGHRSVGGVRASLYNGMPMKGVEALEDFMKSFAEENAQ